MIARLLGLSVGAMLMANVANATVYYNTLGQPVTEGDGPIYSGVDFMGDSFTAPDGGLTAFTNISMVLSDTTPGDGGSVMVYLIPDNGGGSAGVAGQLSVLPGQPGSQLLATILDSSLSTTPAATTITAAPSITTSNQEYWVVLEGTAASNFVWWYDSTGSGFGTANQKTVYDDPPATYMMASDGTYELAVFTPEPTSLAILGASLAGLGFLRRRQTKKA